MGSINPDSEAKQELDDSGYVQEEGLKDSPIPASSDETDEAQYSGTTQLLDLSDDALLYILRYCSPLDLKALGLSAFDHYHTCLMLGDDAVEDVTPFSRRYLFTCDLKTHKLYTSGKTDGGKITCTRLATLILDRTLWSRVDARSAPCGPRRVRWFLSHGISASTTALMLSGYAKDAKGCLGFIVGSNDKADEGGSGDGPSTSHVTPDENETRCTNSSNEDERIVPPRLFRLTSQSLPRYEYGHGTPCWPESQRPKKPSNLVCRGPRVTMTHAAFKQLVSICPKLEELALDYCIIDCATVNVSMFPKHLKKLSLRGSKCFNLEKSFLFKIQDHLTDLEELDLSYCEWVEPACMLPLSKLPKLHTLYMRECPKLSEFVAYASLATRYGFKTLKVLDLRGCPVGDSEVSALGWLPQLEQLSLARAEARAPRADHAHYTPAPHSADNELEDWEELEPEFFKNKLSEAEGYNDEQNSRIKSIPNAQNGNNPNSYVFLERMVAEPVAPDEYSQVYQRFLSDTPNAPLTTPEEYRQAYISYLTRNRPYITPTGYIMANPSNRRVYNVSRDENGNENEPNANNDRAQNDEAGPSGEKAVPKNDEDANQAGTSKDGEPSAKKAKLDDSGPSNSSNENNLSGYVNISSTNRKIFDEYHISDDDSDDDDGPPQSKKARRSTSNGIPNTSKKPENPDNNDGEPSTSTCKNAESNSKKQRYIRFRQHQPPFVIEELQTSNNNEESNNNNNNSDVPNEPGNSNDRQEPKHRILVVNVGRRRHAMYQLSLPVCTVAEPVDLRTNNVHPLSRNVSSLIYASQLASRLDHGALVTDSAIQRFGRADGENISYVQIGPNGPIPAPFNANNDRNARPDRSNLRRLSVTGFRHVTDASLSHLATAAPRLEFIDFTNTGVTRSGVEQFKSLRPDVEVIHSPFEKEEDPS